MVSKTKSGFTIIETMLFLAVTGALAVAILVGSGASIGQQRYRDSVNTLKSYLQDQYNQTSNVVNARTGNEGCSSLANVTPAPLQESRGTSECLMLGRFVTIDGTHLTASNVIGYRSLGAPQVPATDDLTELSYYKLGTSPIDQDTTDVAWGAEIINPTPPNASQQLSMLIIRSPLSGSIMTYTTPHIETDLASMITLANSTATRDLCVKGNTGTFVGKMMEVQISPYATSQGSVQIPPESSSVCQ
jgi:type II secretory pathway pseudopilin PulG